MKRISPLIVPTARKSLSCWNKGATCLCLTLWWLQDGTDPFASQVLNPKSRLPFCLCSGWANGGPQHSCSSSKAPHKEDNKDKVLIVEKTPDSQRQTPKRPFIPSTALIVAKKQDQIVALIAEARASNNKVKINKQEEKTRQAHIKSERKQELKGNTLGPSSLGS